MSAIKPFFLALAAMVLSLCPVESASVVMDTGNQPGIPDILDTGETIPTDLPDGLGEAFFSGDSSLLNQFFLPADPVFFGLWQPSLPVIQRFPFFDGMSHTGSLLLMDNRFFLNATSFNDDIVMVYLLGDGNVLHSYSVTPEISPILREDGSLRAEIYRYSDQGTFSPDQLSQVSTFSMEIQRRDTSMASLSLIQVPEPSTALYGFISMGILFFRRDRMS